MELNSVITAHNVCKYNRLQVEQSGLCGCFCCLSVFHPSRIKEWIHDGQTAICADCGIDSIIAAESGYPITGAFLRSMQAYWFSDNATAIQKANSAIQKMFSPHVSSWTFVCGERRIYLTEIKWYLGQLHAFGTENGHELCYPLVELAEHWIRIYPKHS